LRGIHKSPYEKYVTVLSGKIIDYIIDFTDDKITYKKYVLDSEENNHIFIPANKGHLFISLEDDTQLLYQLGGKYDVTKDVNINYNDPYINLDIPWNNKYILSDKDTNSKFTKPVDYILMGSTGFLGSEMKKYLENQDKNFITLDTRLNNYDEIQHKFNLYKPKYVICAAGISGRPTISWCDENKEETFKVNVIDTLKLCEITNKLGIHLTLFGSGSVYNGLFDDKNHPTLITYTEKSVIEKNNDKYYLKCRNILEDSLELYSNVLYLRIQYPISLTQNPKCFMNKMLTRLESVHDQYVNITYLPNLFPLLISIILKKDIRGILNFVNPGHIRLTELLELYREKNNKKFTFNTIKSSNFCGLLNTSLLESILEDKVISIKNCLE
jgi:dTDP-4-dehydrorhamnose reductase